MVTMTTTPTTRIWWILSLDSEFQMIMDKMDLSLLISSFVIWNKVKNAFGILPESSGD